MMWVHCGYDIHTTYTHLEGSMITFTEFRQQHNLTKQQVYAGSGLKRTTLATIENNLRRAKTHTVVQLIHYYQSIDPAVKATTFIE